MNSKKKFSEALKRKSIDDLEIVELYIKDEVERLLHGGSYNSAP